MPTKIRFLLTVLFALPALTALAAGETPAVERVDTLVNVDVVSVTAIKQGLDLRRQPVASSIVGSDDIASGNIDDLKTAALLVPNMHIPDYGSRMTSSIYVRGMGARIDQPVVGMNVDNLPLMNKNSYDAFLIDAERIEVLRGPQSTLYGRNTMGGVVNVYTPSPLSRQEARLSAEYGSGRSLKVRAAVYNPLSERVGFSVTGYYAQRRGFFRNQLTNRFCDNERSGGGRLRFRMLSRRGLTLDNALSFSSLRQDGYPYAYAGTEDLAKPSGEVVARRGVIAYNDTCAYHRTFVSDGLTLSCETGGVSISSITGYQYLQDCMRLDQDFTPMSYFTLTQSQREHALTEDFVVRSRNNEGRYSWLAGAFAFYKHNRMEAPVDFYRDGIDSLILKHAPALHLDDRDHILFDSRFRAPSWGVALYHSSQVRLGAFDLRAGLRLAFESAALRFDCSSSASGSIGDTSIVPFDYTGRLRKRYFEWLPEISASWRIDNHNSVYLRVAKGSKAGGFNTQMFSEVVQSRLMEQMHVYWHRDFDVEQAVAYDPEWSLNYEAGAHVYLPQARLSAQAALFFIDCFDKQLTVFPEGQTTGRMMTNAGHARSFGGEVSLSAEPLPRFNIDAAYGYTDARFVRFRSGLDDFAGKYVPYAPRHTVSVRLSYGLKIDREWLRHITFAAGWTGTGDIWWDEANTLRQPFYGLFDCSLALSARHYTLRLWCDNVAGTRYDVFYFESIGHSFLQRGLPRRFGVKLEINI